jgi:hypothetical protein
MKGNDSFFCLSQNVILNAVIWNWGKKIVVFSIGDFLYSGALPCD